MVKTTTLLTILIAIIFILVIDHIRIWIQLKAAQDCIGYLNESIHELMETLIAGSEKYRQDVILKEGDN